MPDGNTKLPPFDPDFPPTHDINRRAAEARGLKWDPRQQYFVDNDGLPALDRFGQRL